VSAVAGVFDPPLELIALGSRQAPAVPVGLLSESGSPEEFILAVAHLVSRVDPIRGELALSEQQGGVNNED
jgi:hypothetical protein